jgi:hypothetical protein
VSCFASLRPACRAEAEHIASAVLKAESAKLQFPGLHWRHWHKLEKGEINVTLASVVGVAAALGTTAPALFTPPR